VNNGQFGLGHFQQESHHALGDSALEVERCALSVSFRRPGPGFLRFSWTTLIRTLFNSSALRHLAGLTHSTPNDPDLSAYFSYYTGNPGCIRKLTREDNERGREQTSSKTYGCADLAV
jgi:hypothetical protein